MRFYAAVLPLCCLFLGSCRDKDVRLDTGDVDTGEGVETGTDSAGETSIETGGDTSGDTSVVLEVSQGSFAFCAGGGWVSGADVQGVTCTAPLDIASITATRSDLTWQPGPITFIAP